MATGGRIDAISVGLGLDMGDIRSQARQAKQVIEKDLPTKRTINVYINVHANQRSVRDLYESVRQQFNAFSKQANQGNSTQALRLAPKMVVDPRVMRDFRRDIEREMRQAGNAGHAIHVPIRFNGDTRGFLQSVQAAIGTQHITVGVRGRWEGWEGGGPPSGGGVGGRGPRGGGGGPAPTGGGTAPAGPAPARSAPRRPTAQGAMAGGVETRTSDVYVAPPFSATPPAATPSTTPRQARQEARRTRMAGGGGYIEPPGGRVDIGNVRRGSTEPMTPRPSRMSANRSWPPQPGERQLSATDIAIREDMRRQLERKAQRIRQEQSRMRMASPADAEARAFLSSGFSGLDPDLGAVFDTLADPQYKGNVDDLLNASVSGRAAFQTAFRGSIPKNIRRQIGVARGTRKGDVMDIDPMVLSVVSALDASQQFIRGEQDPLYFVRSGDNKRRGRGGKVGKSGGLSAGRMASETVDPAAIQDIIERRRIGGRGNGWTSLEKQYGRATVSRARSIVGERGARDPIEDIQPGMAYGGFLEDAPSIPGGQGLIRVEPSPTPRSPLPADLIGGADPATRNARYAERRPTYYGSPNSPIASPLARFLMGRGRTIGRFAEGGVPGRLLRDYFSLEGGVPRTGSMARNELEARYLKGMRERERRAAKPTYQQGGRSDPLWRSIAENQYLKDPFCAYCGRRTEKGAKGKLGFRADHLEDVGSGGAMYDPANVVTACNSCNSYKSGGRSARPLAPGARRALLPSGMAEGGVMKSGGLLQRMAQAGHEPSITMLGERGMELAVTDPNTGETEIVPHHKVPAWLQRAQQGKGLAKDLTGRQEGGTFPRIQYRGGGASGRAHWVSPGAAAGTATQAGLASALGDAQRVFVVNWPAFLSSANQFAQGMGQAARSNPTVGQAAAGVGAPPGMGAGGGAPAGAPTPGSGGRARADFNPLAGAEARRYAGQDVGSLNERIGAVRAGISGSLQEVPVRALSVAFGQIAQQMIGGRAGILERGRTAARLAGEAQQEVGELERLTRERQKLIVENRDIDRGITELSPEDAAATKARNLQRIPRFTEAIQFQSGVAESAVGLAESEEKKILTRGQQFKAQAVGLGGIIGGTAVFSAAISAFTFATSAAATALDPLVQSLMGFPAAADRATTSLRDAIVGMGGQVGPGLAAGAAPSGVSAAFLDRNRALTSIATNRAAQIATGQALDITRAGLRNPNEGLFEGTGGLFGSNVLTELFGGQPGVLQDVEKRLQSVGPGRTRDMAVTDNPFAYLIEKWTPFRTQVDNPVRTFDAGDQKAVIDDLNNSLKSAAEFAGNASDAFQLTTTATEAQTKAMIDSAAAVSDEARTRAEGFARQGVTVLGPGGQALTGRQFEQFGNAEARSALIQDPTLLLRATQNQRRAAMAGIMAQGTFARQEDIPGRFALQEIANPRLRFGQSFNNQRLGQTDQQTRNNIARYTELAGRANTSIDANIDRGMSALEQIVSRIDNPTLAGGIGPGGPGRNLMAFRGAVGQVGAIGQQIAGIQSGINLRQVNLQVNEYANQIRLTQRALGDAQDFWAGINGSVSNTVGGLQAQNFLLDRQNQMLSRRSQQLSFQSEQIGFQQADLQRQSQLLGFELSQRQINFQRAQAGFTAPGLTPEERAARINEAKIEADYAQRQLDIQIKIANLGQEQLKIAKTQSAVNREMFANQVAQQNNAAAIARMEAQRAVEDLTAQLALLQEGQSVAIDTAAAEEAIERLRGQQQLLVEEAQSYVEQGQAIRDQVLADTKDLMANTGKGFAELVDNVQTAWAKAFQSAYSDFLLPLNSALNAMGGNYTQGSAGWNVPAANRKAAGGIDTVNSPTMFMAGEAGTEHVIVLRNAKQGMMYSPPSGSSAAGGGAVYINVGGVTLQISGTKDMDEEKLAAAVERRMSTKLAMLAGRPA